MPLVILMRQVGENYYVGHTSGAKEILKKYKVGDIDKTSQPEPWQMGGGTPASAQQFALLVVALVVVFVLWQLFKN